MIPIDDDNPTDCTPYVTWALIVANILAFIWQIRTGLERSVMQMGFIPADLGGGDWSGAGYALSSMFLHGGLLHLIGNLWFLRIFGDNVEDEMGHLRFLIFYIVCGLAADAAHFLSAPTSEIPVVGASGAISGVLGAYMMKHPMAPVRMWTGFLLLPVTELPAFVFLFLWGGMQLLLAMASIGTKGDGGGIAYWAHLGGFIAGSALVWFFAKRGRSWRSGEL
jgi:membrane associated rhomboid family serine protease